VHAKTGDICDFVQFGGIDFFAGEPAEDGGRTATAPRPKYDSVASHISASTMYPRLPFQITSQKSRQRKSRSCDRGSFRWWAKQYSLDWVVFLTL
jgi:hypothetical protein